MKTKLLFSAMVLIGLTSANATKTNVAAQGEDLNSATRYRYAEPVTFMERGLEFLIFPDGSFDFNTNSGNSLNDYDDSFYYKSSTTKRSSINTKQGAPRTASRVVHSAGTSQGILIQHDFDGKVRRIGNVFINYDRIGKVKRVGTIYMNYNRSGTLTQVGGLRLTYNSWGEIVNSSGVVNYTNSQYNYNQGQIHGNSDGHFNDFGDHEDYYYYKQGTDTKKQKKIKR